jgi:mannose-6-phosphate isomerase
VNSFRLDHLAPLRLTPEYRAYVWGGDRLRPGHVPTAEAWVIYAGDVIAEGALAGQTLAQAAEAYGEALLGRRALETTGLRFPLLIKVLDCRQWLSLQVHPNDAQAQALEGPGFFGKTEAWHIIEAAPGAELLCGFKHDLAPEELEAALRDGKAILAHVERMAVQRGETLLLTPGTLHALGPGLLVYEVQQTSDLTYRVYDWDRPLSAGRKLHIEQSLAALKPGPGPRPTPPPDVQSSAPALLTRSQYFELWLLGAATPAAMDTRHASFHALTVLDGAAVVETAGGATRLTSLETALVPAAAGEYQIVPEPGARLLAAMVP